MKDQFNPIVCPTCQGTFLPKRDWQVYCSPKCRTIGNEDKYVKVLKADYEALLANQKTIKKK